MYRLASDLQRVLHSALDDGVMGRCLDGFEQGGNGKEGGVLEVGEGGADLCRA